MPISTKTAEELDSVKEKEGIRLLEAVLFVSGRYLSVQEISSLTDLNSIVIFDLIDRLKDKYNKEDSAIEIVEKENIQTTFCRPIYLGQKTHFHYDNANKKFELVDKNKKLLALESWK